MSLETVHGIQETLRKGIDFLLPEPSPLTKGRDVEYTEESPCVREKVINGLLPPGQKLTSC